MATPPPSPPSPPPITTWTPNARRPWNSPTHTARSPCDMTTKINCTHAHTGEMIIPGERYIMHEIESSMYATQMTLTVKHLHKSDFSGYKCISKNSIGGIEATIRLYGKWRFSLCFVSRFGLLLSPTRNVNYPGIFRIDGSAKRPTT